MKNNSVIYINGDSWCDNRYFKTLLNKTFPNQLIVNATVQGNWNSQINATTINDIKLLSEKFKNINCFVYYSECLRGSSEDETIKQMAKHKTYDRINLLLEDLLYSYHAVLQKKIGDLCKLNMTTAFIDNCVLSTMRPMYQAMLSENPFHKCYSLSKHVKDQSVLNALFDKEENVRYLDSVIERCKLLESIPGMKDYHPDNESLYEMVIADIQNRLA